MTINADIAADIQTLSPTAVIELFELDCTDLGGEVFRFHNGTNKLSQNIVWQGNEYIRFPIQVSGFELSGQGQFPRPTVIISNVMSSITTILLQYKDLLGSKFTRKRTLLKYLDAVNFPGGVNPTEDTSVFLTDDIYYVDRKASENRDQVQFELSSAADLQDVQVPKRVIGQSTCPWVYRSSKCSYTGIPLYDEQDNELPAPASAEAIAMRAAYQDMLDSQTALEVAQDALLAAADAVTAASIYTTTYHYEYVGMPKYYVSVSFFSTQAYFNDIPVTLGTQYTRGVWKETIYAFGQVDLYEIRENLRDEGAYTAAVVAYDAAVIARDSAQTDLTTAENDFDTALAAVPPTDQVYKDDRCGKRLTSCKIRFGANNPLPFGGFPGVGR